MIKLSSNSVGDVFRSCLFSEDELNEEGLPQSTMIKVEAVSNTYGFKKESLETVKDNIIELLMQLGESFFRGIGDGDSFLNAVRNDRGIIWTTSQVDVDRLLALGLGAGVITYSLPRDMWAILPGGMPYFTINLDKIDVIAANDEQERLNAEVKRAIQDARAKMKKAIVAEPANETKKEELVPAIEPKVNVNPKEEIKVVQPTISSTTLVDEYAKEISILTKELSVANVKLKDAELNVTTTSNAAEICTKNEAIFRSKAEMQIKAMIEEETKTKYVASKSQILLDSAKTILANNNSKLKLAQQAVSDSIKDVEDKSESHSRLQNKANEATKALKVNSDRLHDELSNYTSIRKNAEKAAQDAKQAANAISNIVKEMTDRLTTLKSLQSGRQFPTENEDLFETVEMEVPDEVIPIATATDTAAETANETATEAANEYGTFTQIAIREAIDKLPEKTKAIVELHHYKKMSAIDIIAELGTNKGSITKAVKKFNAELESILSKNLG